MEAKKLTNEQIINILTKCKEMVEINKANQNMFLCTNLMDIIMDVKKQYNISMSKVHNYIPLFTHENAVIHANGYPVDVNGCIPVVWFDSKIGSIEEQLIVDNTNRIIFLDWLIEQYSKK